jgi:hypothetical protein
MSHDIVFPLNLDLEISSQLGEVIVARMRRCNEHPPSITNCIWCGEIDRTRNSCPLTVKRENEIHHLVFW